MLAVLAMGDPRLTESVVHIHTRLSPLYTRVPYEQPRLVGKPHVGEEVPCLRHHYNYHRCCHHTQELEKAHSTPA